MQYELFYLVGERQEANLDAIKKNVEEILTTEKAKLLDPEVIEKRKLSYEIKHQKRGTYVTRRFELPEIEDQDEKESVVEKITRKLNLTGDVLRFIIMKTDELPDLGAIERRRAQEMGQGKTPAQKPQRQKPQAQPEAKKEEKPQAAPIPKAETKEPAGDASQKDASKEAKDIDKQLDKLLDI